MKRTAINPQAWGLGFSMNQAEVVEGVTRHLHCSGQASLFDDADSELGVSVAHAGDMRAQIGAALAQIDALLEGAGMARSNLLTLRFFTTDIESFLANYDVYADWVAAADIMPPQSLLGVSSLALPGMVVEIEATAGA